jgi:hypothetical protein
LSVNENNNEALPVVNDNFTDRKVNLIFDVFNHKFKEDDDEDLLKIINEELNITTHKLNGFSHIESFLNSNIAPFLNIRPLDNDNVNIAFKNLFKIENDDEFKSKIKEILNLSLNEVILQFFSSEEISLIKYVSVT